MVTTRTCRLTGYLSCTHVVQTPFRVYGHRDAYTCNINNFNIFQHAKLSLFLSF